MKVPKLVEVLVDKFYQMLRFNMLSYTQIGKGGYVCTKCALLYSGLFYSSAFGTFYIARPVAGQQCSTYTSYILKMHGVHTTTQILVHTCRPICFS